MTEENFACAFHSLDVTEVHVFYACTGDFEGYDRLHDVLSQAEKEIAQRFRNHEDRRTYELAHGLLRKLLARYLMRDPAALNFLRSEFGKPYLPAMEVDFNLSHAGKRVAIAVARSPVGVDVEEVKPQPLHDANFVNECLSSCEQRWMEECTDGPLVGFYRLWTLKEAALKADGRGLGNRCQNVVSRMSTEESPAEMMLGGVEWRGYELSAGTGFCLAVAANDLRNVSLYPIRHISQLE